MLTLKFVFNFFFKFVVSAFQALTFMSTNHNNIGVLYFIVGALGGYFCRTSLCNMLGLRYALGAVSGGSYVIYNFLSLGSSNLEVWLR